jgi:hypothetical protein
MDGRAAPHTNLEDAADILQSTDLHSDFARLRSVQLHDIGIVIRNARTASGCGMVLHVEHSPSHRHSDVIDTQ